MLSGLPIGAAAFAVAIAGLVAGVSTLVILLGLPVLAGTLAAARAFAQLERRQTERATGRALPPHHYRDAEGAGFAGWLSAVREPQSWRDLTHMVVAFPVRLTTFCAALIWTVGAVGELSYGLWSWPIPRDADNTGVLDLAFGISSRGTDIAFNTGVGVVLLATAVPEPAPVPDRPAVRHARDGGGPDQDGRAHLRLTDSRGCPPPNASAPSRPIRAANSRSPTRSSPPPPRRSATTRRPARSGSPVSGGGAPPFPCLPGSGGASWTSPSDTATTRDAPRAGWPCSQPWAPWCSSCTTRHR